MATKTTTSSRKEESFKNSKRETIVISDGSSRYTKRKDVHMVSGTKIGIPVSTFWALEDIPKVAHRRPRTDQVFCRARSSFYVIGKPKGDDDTNTYVVYSNTRGILKRPWNEIVLCFGKKSVMYGETRVLRFDVSNVGKSDNKTTYMINLSKKHIWLLKEWVDKGVPRGDYKVLDLPTLLRVQARPSCLSGYDSEDQLQESQPESLTSSQSGERASPSKSPRPVQVPNGNVMVYSPLVNDASSFTDEQKMLFLMSVFRQPQRVYYVQFPPDI